MINFSTYLCQMIFSNDNKARLNSAFIQMVLYVRHSDSAMFSSVTTSFVTLHSRLGAVSGNCCTRGFAHLGRCCRLPFVPNRVSHRSGRIILFTI